MKYVMRPWARLRLWTVSTAVILLIVGIIQSPGVTLLCVLGLLAAIALFVAPRAALGIVAVFLVLQPALVNLVGGPETPIGLAVRRVHEVVVLAGVVRIAVFVGWRRLPESLSAWLFPVAAFVVAGMASAMVGHVPVGVAVLGAGLSLKFPIFFLLALTVQWNEQDARRLIRAGVVLGPILLVLGVVLLTLPIDVAGLFLEPGAELEGFFVRGELRSMQGPFTHPGVFGWAMAVTGCFAVAQLMQRPNSIAASSLGSSVIGIVASLRRKPLFALPVAAISAVVTIGTRRQRLITGVLLSVAALAVLRFGGSRLRAIKEDTVVSYFDPYAPTAALTLLYVTGWTIAREHFPLGAGFGRFGGYASQLYYSPVYDQYGLSMVSGLSRDFPNYISDTYWPHIMGETGVLGAVALLVFFWRVLRGCGRAAYQSNGGPLCILAIAAGMILVEALVESTVAPIFESALQAYVVAIPLGVVTVLSARGRAALSPAAAVPAPFGGERSSE